jgi:hypothetical protein
MRGSLKQAADYCKKDGLYEEWGDIPKPGKRNDLIEAVTTIQGGAPLSELVDDPVLATTYVKYSRGLTSLRSLVLEKQPLNVKTVVWISGPTGVGKTRSVVDFCNENKLNYWMSGEDLKWFDRYEGQEIAVFDDFRWKHCSFSFLLRLLDRYELRVPIKGGFVRWNPKIIFITTPKTIRETFTTEWREEEDLKQIERRVHMKFKYPENRNSILWNVLKLKVTETPSVTPTAQQVAEEALQTQPELNDSQPTVNLWDLDLPGEDWVPSQ